MPLKAPWKGRAKISQGNFGPFTHNTWENRSFLFSDLVNINYPSLTEWAMEIDQRWDHSYALDFELPVGTEILAPADGIITYKFDDFNNADTDYTYGMGTYGMGGVVLAIEHTAELGQKFTTVYFHLNAISKNIGDNVTQGEVIAQAGASCFSSLACTSPAHTHFYIRNYDGEIIHSEPFQQLLLKKLGVDDGFVIYGSKGKSLQDSQVAGKWFFSNNYDGDVDNVDSDYDGIFDVIDNCPNSCNHLQLDADTDGIGDACDPTPSCGGCGQPTCEQQQPDLDNDGIGNACDGCQSDPEKIVAGACSCGVADTDSDSDGIADCNDGCIHDPFKTSSGICGCGVADTDSDSDGIADCNDGCIHDPFKNETREMWLWCS